MTLAEQIVADVATVFLNEDDFAETVTRIASDGTRDDFIAVVHLERVKTDSSKGLSHRYEGTMVLDDSVEVDEKQCWMVRGNKFTAVPGIPESGMVSVNIKQVRHEYRTVGGEVL